MKRFYRGFMLVALSVVCAGAVLAAEGEWVPSEVGKPQAAYSWGPYTGEGTTLSDRTLERFSWSVGGGWLLQPYAEASAVYDDNVFLGTHDQQDELYTMFTPGVTLLYGTPRQNYLYLDYSADFTSLDAGDNDAFDGQSLTAGLNHQGAKSQFNLSHQYREVRDVDVQVGTRLKRKSNTSAASYDNRVSSKTALGVLGRYMVSQYDEGTYADYRDYMAGGRITWQMRPKTALFGQASHGWVDIDESRDAYGSAQYDEASVGIHGRPRPRLETSGQVGVQHRYFEDDRLDDITREVGSLKIAGNPMEYFHAWVNLSAGLHPAINGPGYTVFDTRIEPGISRRLFTDRVLGSLSYLYGRTDYLGRGEGSVEDGFDPRVYDGREDTYWGLNANIDYWIGRYWCVGVGYSYINNDSTADGRQVDGRVTDPASYDAGRWMLRASFNK